MMHSDPTAWNARSSGRVRRPGTATGRVTEVVGRLAALLRTAGLRRVALIEAVYLPLGFAMHAIGHALRIAEFAHAWQVLPCYGLYLVVVTLAVRGRPALEQYAFGLLALAPYEMSGYAFGTSIAHDGNVIDTVLGPRNFALAMAVFFGALPLAGNQVVDWLEGLLPPRRAAWQGKRAG